MDAERTKLYGEIGRTIGDTPLVQYGGQVSNDNSIWVKKEFDNPFGSHYDRVYLALFRAHEEKGEIRPGDKVLETSSGAAGVSFAGIGKLLGYECFVALPAGGERARERAITEQLRDEDHLILTPAENYVSGFPGFLRDFLPRHRDHYFLNHSMGARDSSGHPTNNETTLNALRNIAKEAAGEEDFNYFIPAVGNGSSVLGPGRHFHDLTERLTGVVGGLMEEPSSFGRIGMVDVESALQYIDEVRTRIVPFETFQSAVMYGLKYPGRYEIEFGMKPGSLSRHSLPGTSFQGIDFPHIGNSVANGLVDDVVLVSDRTMDREYTDKTGRDDSTRLVHWDAPINGSENEEFGRTTLAGINVALRLAENVGGKNFLVIGYDKADRYDS